MDAPNTAEGLSLRVTAGELRGQRHAVAAELVVGRSSGCDLPVPDGRLSRRHARFFVEGGALHVEDLESRNGTTVNGARIRRQRLAPGDVVAMGGTEFVVERGADAAVPAAADDDAVLPPRLLRPAAPAASAPSLNTMAAAEFFRAIGASGAPGGAADPARVAFLEQQTRKFAILYEVSAAVQREQDARAMLTAVLDVVLKVVDADAGFVALLDADGAPVVEVARGREARAVPPERATLSRTLTAHVLRDRCGVITADAPRDARFAGAPSVAHARARAIMAVPIVVGSRVLGLIELESARSIDGFGANDLDLLTVVASVAGVALHNLRLAAQREQTIRELRAAQQQLLSTQEQLIRAEQLAAVGRLASGIAHEVKNHLSPFMLADMIAARYPDDAEIREAAELMLDAQRRIYGLVNEVRNFASGAAAQHEFAPTDVAALVEGVIRFVRCDAVVKRVRVAFERRGAPVVVLDANRIRQVLINLLRNAADAVEPRRGRITVRVDEHGDGALVEVTDDGPGIPPEVAARIFEPFFTTKGDEGLGLGLDISRSIVAAHGGTLSFESAPGAGTTFRVTLPERPPRA